MADSAFFVDSGGSIRELPPAEVEGAAQLGWIPASPKQIEEFQANARYGTAGQQAIAGLEGFARGITLGVSTPIERALGVDPAGIAGREKANPATAAITEGVGVAAPLLSTLGGAAPLTGPGLALRAGKAVTQRLAPEATTVAGRILGAGAATAAGSAVEGAFYGAGRVVHEMALGDPNLTAQSALATVGLSAALLGGISGTGKVLAGVVREYAPRELGAKVVELAERAEAHANFNATNAMPLKVKEVMRGKGGGATELGLRARDLGILKNPLSDSPDAILDRAMEVRGTAGKELDSIASAASQQGPRTNWTRVYQDVHAPIVNALRANGSTVGLADQFDGFLQKYAQAYAGRDLDVAGLWRLRQDIGDFIYKNGKVLDPWVKDLNTPVKRVYDHIDQLIADGVKEGGGADALKAWEKANQSYETASTFATLAQSGVERSAANNSLHLTGTLGTLTGFASHGVGGGALLGSAMEATRRRGASAVGFGARVIRNALRNGGEELADKTAEIVAAARQAGTDIPLEVTPAEVTVLSALERINGQVTDKINHAASTIVRAGPKAKTVGRAEAAAGIAHVFGKAPDESAALYKKRVAEIQKLAQDPEQLHRALIAQTDDWYAHAPKTAEAMNATSARGIAFLASKVPHAPISGPLAPKWSPSREDISHFTRYFDAVEHPLNVLKQASAGTLTPEAVEAIQAVHPHLLEKMRGALVEKMSVAKVVPYQSRLMLSLLMQQDMDGSLSMPSLSHAQASFLRPVMPVPKAPGGKAGKISLSSRTLTPMQSSAGRGGR